MLVNFWGRCRGGTGPRIAVEESLADRIAKNARRYGIVMRAGKNGKYYL